LPLESYKSTYASMARARLERRRQLTTRNTASLRFCALALWAAFILVTQGESPDYTAIVVVPETLGLVGARCPEQISDGGGALVPWRGTTAQF
jgi:hypothetical protein